MKHSNTVKAIFFYIMGYSLSVVLQRSSSIIYQFKGVNIYEDEYEDEVEEPFRGNPYS